MVNTSYPIAAVALAHASRLLNHGPTVLISSAHGAQRNVMAAAWSMPVEFDPPRIAVVVDKRTFTRQLVEASGQLAISIPCRALADVTYTVGSVSGHDLSVDKFHHLGIDSFDGPVLGLPLVTGCVAWLECQVLPEAHTEQAYDTFFVTAVSAQADPRVFADGRWRLHDAPPQLQTLHHLGAGAFAVTQQVVQARKLAPEPKD